MGKIGFLITGAVLSPILLFFGHIALVAIGIIAIAIVGSTFFDELKKLEEDSDG